MRTLSFGFVAMFMVGTPVWSEIVRGEEPDIQNAGDRVSCSNDRYEDFMRIQYEKQKAEENRQRYADEIKVTRAENAKRVEAARLLYRRDAKADDSKAEAAWLLEQKAVKEEAELIRRRFVQARDQLEKSRCQGLKIPELKEYDLENY